MKWSKLKTIPANVLYGVTVEAEYVDKQLVAVTITDESGDTLRIEAAETYSRSLIALAPAEPETVERWFVRGAPSGVCVLEAFEHENDAINRCTELTGKLGDGLEIAKEKVFVDDDGTVAVVGLTAADNDLPF